MLSLSLLDLSNISGVKRFSGKTLDAYLITGSYDRLIFMMNQDMLSLRLSPLQNLYWLEKNHRLFLVVIFSCYLHCFS